MITTTIRLALVATLICAGSAGQAQQASTRYHRYELATEQGQRAVLARIERSAKRACEPDNTVAVAVAAKSCTADLTAQMVARSGSPALAMRAGGKDIQLASNGR